MPPATSGPFKPEPILEETEYQHILDVIESMVKVMERSPKAFHSIDEEALRTHFIVQLNGHYEGQATGETFNYHRISLYLRHKEDVAKIIHMTVLAFDIPRQVQGDEASQNL
jgi:hypothetical protein